MDQETKNYIDRKFTEQAAHTVAEQQAAHDLIASKKKKVLGMVLVSAGFMLLLLCGMLYLLYKFQLRGFLQ